MTIVVCGAGTMGIGIAENAARAGYSTILYDLAPGALEKASSSIEKNLDQLAEKKKITAEEKTTTLERLQFINDLRACKGDIIIEAIVETAGAKIDLFRQLAATQEASTIFASNTSSISISKLASELPHPERVCGMHFFNPAQVMKLVEVVEGSLTAPWVTEKIVALAKSMGKVPVNCKDSPGFIVNRVARHYYLEAFQLLEEGIDVSRIDLVLEASGFRMGSFRLMDLIGNDINYAVTESLYEAFGKQVRFRPSEIQREKVLNNELGRKTGKGFYTY